MDVTFEYMFHKWPRKQVHRLKSKCKQLKKVGGLP